MRTALVVFVSIVLATTASAVGFKNTFDKEPADGGSPDSFSVYGTEVMDRGVTTQTASKGRQSAYVIADFGMDTWGIIVLSDFGSWDLRDAKLSCDIRSSTSFKNKKPVVGFKLIDEDGTGYRTPEHLLFTPSMKWEEFEHGVADLIPDEEKGENPTLDLKNITQYGIIFFDQDDNNKMVSFYLDEFNAKK